jgi:mannosyltransferase OCH1-like enzyme
MDKKEIKKFLGLIIPFLVIIYLFVFWNPFLFIGKTIKTIEKFENPFGNNESQTKIPKIIHQIWLGPGDPPTKLMNTWKIDYIKMYPDFEYVLWDDKKIKELYWSEDLTKIYNLEKDPKAKSDIARLLILYFKGGIYIDPYAKWVNDKNLNDLILKAYRQENNFFVAREPIQNWIGNGVLGSVKKHPALNFLLEKLEIIADGYKEIREKTPSYIVTGPVFVNRAVMDNYPITIFPDVFFYYPPKSWNGKNDCNNNDKLLEQVPKTAYMVNYNYSRNNPSDFS